MIRVVRVFAGPSGPRVRRVLDSMHEERRLRTAYGEAFERYREKVPFLIPRPPRD